MSSSSARTLSLPKTVAQAGGIPSWIVSQPDLRTLFRMVEAMCQAGTVAQALAEVKAVMSLGHNIWAYAYMRMLYHKNMEVFYGVLLAEPQMLLPVVYTPTVGEACQKFGKMPLYPRGCFIAISDRGNIRAVLLEYAEAHLHQDKDGKYMCDCIVFSDAGRILGLGDLGTWGMGIPIGKLDLYTVCAGVNPHRTIPVILDAGCTDSNGNTDKLLVRDHPLYTGLKQNRVMHKSEAGTMVNSAYYGEGNMIEEFMLAATDLFGTHCLLQFEDFNSNDAFPLLAQYRDRFLTYNDDIQGTAAVAVAALLGAIKMRSPEVTDLINELRKETFLFHGSGSANIGTMRLLAYEAGVEKSKIFCTNSKGVVWKDEGDASTGNFRNEEQKEFAMVGKPTFIWKDLVACVDNLAPTALIGAVGRDPGCFNRAVVEALVKTNKDMRPCMFALSNPKTQAEITSIDCWAWSNGKVIFGSGTGMESFELNGKSYFPGQVNNVYIFPGVSMGAIACKATRIPERFFMVAAEAVANSLDANDLAQDRVVPHPSRIRDVGLNVATAVVVEAQKMGLADCPLGKTPEEVRSAVHALMWAPGKGDVAKEVVAEAQGA